MKVISQEVLAVLGTMEVDADLAVIGAGQLDPKLYKKVNEVLEAIGGKWNRRRKGHVFDKSIDPQDAIDRVVMAGGFVDAKQEFGAFFSPKPVVAKLLELAQPKPGQLVLEPSAGDGAIALELMRLCCKVLAYEVLNQHTTRMALRALDVSEDGTLDVRVNDFLSVELPDAKALRDLVVMNPPFAKQADLDHVLRAARWVRPGGRLVSVMSAGVEFRDNKRTRDFKAQLAQLGNYRFEKLPDGAFEESGTLVRTVVLVLDLFGTATKADGGLRINGRDGVVIETSLAQPAKAKKVPKGKRSKVVEAPPVLSPAAVAVIGAKPTGKKLPVRKDGTKPLW